MNSNAQITAFDKALEHGFPLKKIQATQKDLISLLRAIEDLPLIDAQVSLFESFFTEKAGDPEVFPITQILMWDYVDQYRVAQAWITICIRYEITETATELILDDVDARKCHIPTLLPLLSQQLARLLLYEDEESEIKKLSEDIGILTLGSGDEKVLCEYTRQLADSAHLAPALRLHHALELLQKYNILPTILHHPNVQFKDLGQAKTSYQNRVGKFLSQIFNTCCIVGTENLACPQALEVAYAIMDTARTDGVRSLYEITLQRALQLPKNNIVPPAGLTSPTAKKIREAIENLR